jgi:hypothetical protein
MGGAVMTAAQKQRYAGIPVRSGDRLQKIRLQWAAMQPSPRGDLK